MDWRSGIWTLTGKENMKILWLGLEQDIGVDALLMNKNTFDIDKIAEYQPDLVIEREFNAAGLDWRKEIPKIREVCPRAITAAWLIDSHVKGDFHKKYAQLFDFVFVAISNFLNELEHKNKFWLPLCHTSNILLEPGDKQHKVGFVGSHGTAYLEDRTEFYRMIKDIFPNFYLIKDYATYYARMNSIGYIVNLSYNGDMNFRTFEALGSGCGLITSDVPDLYKIDGLVDRISIFKNFNECVDKIKENIDKPIVSHTNWIRDNHMIKNRVEAIINMVETGMQETF